MSKSQFKQKISQIYDSFDLAVLIGVLQYGHKLISVSLFISSPQYGHVILDVPYCILPSFTTPGVDSLL